MAFELDTLNIFISPIKSSLFSQYHEIDSLRT